MHVVVGRKIFCTWGYCLVLKKVPNKHISQFSCNGAEFRFKRVTDCICLQLRIPKILPLADLQQSVLKYHKGHIVSLFVLAPARFIVSIPLTYFLHSFSGISVYTDIDASELFLNEQALYLKKKERIRRTSYQGGHHVTGEITDLTTHVSRNIH